MIRICLLFASLLFNFSGLPACQLFAAEHAHPIDRLLAAENAERGITTTPAPVVDDFAFLRRVYVDLIGRIPTHDEIEKFLALPSDSRRQSVVDELLQHERFADRWTGFYADMLRIRSNAEGGGQLLAYVHQAVAEGMPYDQMCRKLIATNGKVGSAPEVGWVLGDNADPMALAGVTSQVFLGVRIACAQCHDHPFDVWTQEDFYGLAAFFGKTRREERQVLMRTLGIYTLDVEQTAVLWPPEGEADDSERKPMQPTFPFELATSEQVARTVARLAKLRSDQLAAASKEKQPDPNATLDALLAESDDLLEKRTQGKPPELLDVAGEAKRDVRKLKIQAGRYSDSELRTELAKLVTDPRNRFFSRCFANRVWNELTGRGIVNPIDDFSAENQPSHSRTLDYLADEFVASGYDLRSLIRTIVTSDLYRRSHVATADEATRTEMEAAFLALPMRRMISETLYDSIVTAGHLFDKKHEAGKNLKTVWQSTRVMKRNTAQVQPRSLAGNDDGEQQPAMRAPGKRAPAAVYNLEAAIELDFKSLLKEQDEEVAVDKMMVKSTEEIEAERMQQERQRRQADYIDRFVRATIDDNPQFSSSFRMPSPAPEGHFVRVFGQPARLDLGEEREQDPTMRQALMILNGRLTHEASRIGELEPLYALLNGKNANLDDAIRLVYLELLTRQPSAEEIADAKAIVAEANTPQEGIADLRWVILNSNEFRFLP